MAPDVNVMVDVDPLKRSDHPVKHSSDPDMSPESPTTKAALFVQRVIPKQKRMDTAVVSNHRSNPPSNPHTTGSGPMTDVALPSAVVLPLAHDAVSVEPVLCVNPLARSDLNSRRV
jgi:hypothetical protein